MPVLDRISGWRNRWQSCEFPSLPPLVDGQDAVLSDYDVLARGLSDLLARCNPRGARRQFPAALMGFRGLKLQIKHGWRPELPAQVLSDLCHEIAGHADPATLEAAVRCLRRRAEARLPAPVLQVGGDADSTAFMVQGWEAQATVMGRPQSPVRR